jgi:hypothetical protein
MERKKEDRSKEKVTDQTQVSDEALDKVTGGATIPVKRVEPPPPPPPQPRIYRA